jgi:hypothetical protein
MLLFRHMNISSIGLCNMHNPSALKHMLLALNAERYQSYVSFPRLKQRELPYTQIYNISHNKYTARSFLDGWLRFSR